MALRFMTEVSNVHLHTDKVREDLFGILSLGTLRMSVPRTRDKTSLTRIHS